MKEYDSCRIITEEQFQDVKDWLEAIFEEYIKASK